MWSDPVLTLSTSLLALCPRLLGPPTAHPCRRFLLSPIPGPRSCSLTFLNHLERVQGTWGRVPKDRGHDVLSLALSSNDRSHLRNDCCVLGIVLETSCRMILPHAHQPRGLLYQPGLSSRSTGDWLYRIGSRNCRVAGLKSLWRAGRCKLWWDSFFSGNVYFAPKAFS